MSRSVVCRRRIVERRIEGMGGENEDGEELICYERGFGVQGMAD